MNGATLDSELLSNTGATTTNYPSTERWIDLNKSYHFIEDLLTQEVGEYYFYQQFTSTTTVAGQKEYTIPAEIVGNLDGTNKVLGISLDYGNGYVKANKVDENGLDKDVSWYETHQPTSDPVYSIMDNSAMIYPAPTATTIGNIRWYVVQNLIDISDSTTEENMFNGKIHKKYHYLISLGAEQYRYIRAGQKDKAQEAEARFHGKLFGEYVNGKYIPGFLDIVNTRQRGSRIRQMPAGFKVNI